MAEDQNAGGIRKIFAIPVGGLIIAGIRVCSYINYYYVTLLGC